MEEFETISGTLVICPIEKKSYKIFIEKSGLFVLEEDDKASVELRVKSDAIAGRLTYLKGGSRSAKVEIEANYNIP